MGSKTNKAYEKDAIGVDTLDTLEDAKNYNDWLASMINPLMGTKNVELGAGQGTLSALLALKKEVILSDLSKSNLKTLRSRFKYNKNVIDIGDDLFSMLEKHGPVDCIFSSNVLEHIEGDVEIIEATKKHLTKNGVFVAIVPASKYLYSDFDKQIGHFRRYDKKYVKEKFGKIQGYKLVKLNYFDPVGAVGWFIAMRIMKSKKISNMGVGFFDKLVPFLKFLSLLPFPFGKNIFFVLKKIG